MTVIDELLTRVGFQIDKSSAKAALDTLEAVNQAGVKLRRNLASLDPTQAAAAGIGRGSALRNAIIAAQRQQEKSAVVSAGKAVAGAIPGAPQEATSAAGFDLLKRAAQGFLALKVVQGIRSAAHEMMELGLETKNSAERFGISTKSLQELTYVGATAGLSFEQLTHSLTMAQERIGKFADGDGNKNLQNAFRKAGVAASELKGKGIDEQLALFADGFKKIEDPAERMRVAMDLFGRSGGRLIPILMKGSAGIGELRKEAAALGGGLSNEAVEGLNKWAIATKQLEFAFLGFKGALAVAVIPAVLWLSDKVKSMTLYFADLEKKTHFLTTALLFGLGAALIKLISLANKLQTTQWISAGKFLLVAAAIAVVYAVLDDLYGLFTGKLSLVGEWLAKWGYLEKVDGWVRNIAAGFKTISESGYFKATGGAVKDFVSDAVGRGRDSVEREQYERQSTDPRAREQTRANARKWLADHPASTLPGGTPVIARALGQGVDAAAVDANSSRRVTIGDNSKNHGDVNNISNTTVTVEGDASDTTVKKMKDAIDDNNRKQAHRIRQALVPSSAEAAVNGILK